MKITAEGKEKLQAQIEKLTKDLEKLREEKANAYVLTGDTWHDNPYFNQLEQAEQRLILKIAECKKILDEAELVERDTLYLPEEEIYEIVGHGEADIEAGKIAYDSLVAKNLMGHERDNLPLRGALRG